MIRLFPPSRLTPEGIVRSMLAAGLALGALATGVSLVAHAPSDAAHAAPALEGPLTGGWRTFANGDRINRMYRDGDTLWASTDGGGVVRWNLADGSHVQYLAPQDGLQSNITHDVVVMPDGTIWVATEGGLARRLPGAAVFESFTPANMTGMPARVVTALELTADGLLWVGFGQEWDPVTVDPKSREPGTFKKGGAALLNPEDLTWSHEYHARLEGTIGSGGEEKYYDLPSENITDIEVGTDGIAWFGTKPYYVWDPYEYQGDDPNAPKGYWVQGGGGLAAYDGSRWKNWLPVGAGASCYSSQITDLAADIDGRMWVGTAGKGLLLMRNGLSPAGCGTSQAVYTRARRDINPGMRGNYVWSVDVDETGRVWVGDGEGYSTGLGIAILNHNNTFDDSSASNKPWESDDVWQFVDLDSQPGESQEVITDLWVHDQGARYLGLRNNHTGDGDGLRRFDEVAGTWQPFRTAASGPPSNQITGIAHNGATNETWIAYRHAGISRYDGTTWRTWRAFGAGVIATTVKQDLPASQKGHERVPVLIPDKATFDALFPGTARYARIGDDQTLYRITKYTPERLGSGPFIDIEPPLHRATAAGTPVYAIERGPASNDATEIDIDSQGRVWAGGREVIWLGQDCPSDRLDLGECWLDGGLGKWDGTMWSVYWQDELGQGANTIPDQEVQTVAVGKDGRIWVGTGNVHQAEGDGIGVLNPESGIWIPYNKQNQGSRLGSNGIADISVDQASGDVWVAHHASTICVPPPMGGACTPARIGGGVSHFDGSAWEAWTKPSATLKAFGTQGELASVLVDNFRSQVWAGGFDGDSKSMHWNSGYGVDAVLNWCPLDCTNTSWQNKRWPDEGEVAALALDAKNNLWAGVHRNGNGITPPIAGIKLYDGNEWFVYTPANSGLPSNEVTVLEPSGDDMWVGTLRAGMSLYTSAIPPTPTPPPTDAPRATDTATATSTLPGTATQSPTATQPGGSPGPTSTVTPGRTATATPTGPRPTAAPVKGCASRYWRGWCDLFIPFSFTKPACPLCTPLPPRPTPYREPLPQGTLTATPTATASATGTVVPSNTDTATVPATASPTTEAPLTATATSATATGTLPPTDAATATATATSAPPKTWEVVESLPRVTYYDVFGTDASHVWMIGDVGTVLFWDGSQMWSQTSPVVSALRAGVMVSASEGFIVGDESVILETSTGGQAWRKANRGGFVDEWRAVDAINGPSGTVGWVLGASQGMRLKFDGTDWSPSSPADRNTGHQYSGVAMVDSTSAFAIQDATSARMYSWDGTDWSPGVVAGSLSDIDVLSPTQGIAVGARANAWQLGGDGKWASMASRPPTAGRDLFGVDMVAGNQIWAVGQRAGLYLWDGATWSTVSLGAQTRDLRAVWLTDTGDEGWAVGSDGLVVHYK